MNAYNSRKPAGDELIDESLEAANEIQLTFIDANGVVCPDGGHQHHKEHKDAIEVGQVSEGVVGSDAVRGDAFVGQEASGGFVLRGVKDFLGAVESMVLDFGDELGLSFHRSLSPGTRAAVGLGISFATTAVIIALNIAAIYFIFTLILDAGGTVYKLYRTMGYEAVFALIMAVCGLLVAKFVGGYLADNPSNDNKK